MPNNEQDGAQQRVPVTSIDNISFNLNDMLDLPAFIELANAPVYDDDGSKVGINLESHQYHIGFYGTDTISVTCKKGGEPFGYRLAKAYNLRVTRLDLSHDIPTRSIAHTREVWQEAHEKIKAHLALLPRLPKIGTDDGVPKHNSLGFGSHYWSRNNPKQYAVYGKRFPVKGSFNQYEYFLRHEERLHGDLADEAAKWLFKSDETDTHRLSKLFQDVANELFVPDFFQFADVSGFQFTQLPARDAIGSKEDWIIGVVAPSIERYLHETGKDLRPLLYQEVHNLAVRRAEGTLAKAKTTSDKKVARIEHLARQKQYAAMKKAGLLPERIEDGRQAESGTD